jgi:hypothetical protein
MAKHSGGEFIHIINLPCCPSKIRPIMTPIERLPVASLATNFLEKRFAMRRVRPKGDCAAIPLAQGVEVGEDIGDLLALKSWPSDPVTFEGFCH